jgi:arsenate reductase
MSEKPYNVLFLCTGNSARSIIGEVLVNHWGKGRFHGYSAGSHPKGQVNPMTLKLLEHLKFPTDSLRSKDWEEFAQPGAPKMDFVFTVCDRAASEVCPVWPGQPMSAHWGIPDPAEAEGDERTRMLAFRQAFAALENRIKIFVNLPIATLDKLKLQQQLDELGKTPVTQ